MIILFCGSRIWGKNSWTVLDWLHLWNNIQILAEGVTGITSNMVHLHSYELMLAICWEFIWGFQVPARDISRQQSQNSWTSYMLIGFPQSKCPMKIKQRLHNLEFCLDLPVIEGDVLKCLSIITSLGISLCSLSNLENFSHYIFIFFFCLYFFTSHFETQIHESQTTWYCLTGNETQFILWQSFSLSISVYSF